MQATADPPSPATDRAPAKPRRWPVPAALALGLMLGAGAAVAAFWVKPARVYQLPGVQPAVVRSAPPTDTERLTWLMYSQTKPPEVTVSARSGSTGFVDAWVYLPQDARQEDRVRVLIKTATWERAFSLGHRPGFCPGYAARVDLDIGEPGAEVLAVHALPPERAEARR